MPRYYCSRCSKEHDGIPAFHADRPTNYWDVPEDKRETEVLLTSDSCIIANRFFFVRGCLEIPILDSDAVFTWGVWVSLKEESFFLWQDNYETVQRSHLGPFFGWLCTRLPLYPDTMHLRTMVHLRDNGIRPRIELEATEHPLAKAQHAGITMQDALEMVHAIEDDVQL